jgi:hypothetical protein
MRFLDAEAAVVPIESLFHRDPGPHVVRRGTPAARPATLGRMELVTHGEHLRQAADSLERAPSATQRELRAHSLAGTFRALGNAGGGVLADAVARFANAAREVVSSGVAASEPAAFAARLRRAGELLGRTNAGDETAQAAQLDAITATIGPAPAAAPPVPARQSRANAAASAPPADETPPETPDLTGSWVTYQRLVAAGFGAPSLVELLSGGTRVAVASPAAPRPAPAASLSAPAPLPAASVAEPGVVDIRALLFRGDRALVRARELRAEALHARTPEQLREILDELGDLVALALEPSA